MIISNDPSRSDFYFSILPKALISTVSTVLGALLFKKFTVKLVRQDLYMKGQMTKKGQNQVSHRLARFHVKVQINPALN